MDRSKRKRVFGPQGNKIVFMLNLAEYEICPANKYEITNNS